MGTIDALGIARAENARARGRESKRERERGREGERESKGASSREVKFECSCSIENAPSSSRKSDTRLSGDSGN
jgi:hypothetical protein